MACQHCLITLLYYLLLLIFTISCYLLTFCALHTVPHFACTVILVSHSCHVSHVPGLTLHFLSRTRVSYRSPLALFLSLKYCLSLYMPIIQYITSNLTRLHSCHLCVPCTLCLV